VTGLTSVEPVKRFAILDTFLDTTKAMCAGEILAQEAAASGQPSVLRLPGNCQGQDGGAVRGVFPNRRAPVRPSEGPAGMPRRHRDGFRDGVPDGGDLVDGDHGLGPEVNLKTEVLARAERTRGGISTLAPGRHRDSLRDLVDYVITPAIS